MPSNMPFPPQLLEMLAQQVRAGQFDLGAPPPPPEPEVVDPEEAKSRALQAVSMTRAQVADIIQQCNSNTEAGVLSVGNELTQIVQISESYITEVRDTLGQLQSDDGEQGGIVEAISAQATSMHEFMETVSESASRQSKVSNEALEQAQTIIRVGASINEVARSSKMLALNASIEAARLGNAGRSFAVIANQMQALSERVHESNQLVSELAGKLQALLPQIVEDSTTLKKHSESFEQTFTVQMQRVRDDTQTLESALDTVLAGGDTRIATIIRHSQEALSNLQFQDPMAQRLMRIDANMAQLEEQQQGLLTGGVDRSSIERPLQEELGGGVDHDMAPESGEVMLF